MGSGTFPCMAKWPQATSNTLYCDRCWEASLELTHRPSLSGTQNGTLKIIDRKKHIFKLAQGEYIAPEKIENIYLRSEAVAQVFVHGESLQVCPSEVRTVAGHCRVPRITGTFKVMDSQAWWNMPTPQPLGG